MKIVADENIPFVAECFSSIGEVKAVSGRKITAEVVADTDCLLVRSITPVDADLLADSSVRFVGTATIGFEHVDVDFLRSRGIGFASAPGSNANSVAEYIVAALLSVGKKHKIELADKSIGIVGVGNVGSRVEKKVRALGMKVYLNDPPLQRQQQISHREHGEKNKSISIIEFKETYNNREYLAIEEIFDCDFITLHTPLTFEGVDETFHLANEKFFKSLKNGCVFINTARGAVADTNAVKAAIKSGKLKATVLDVWEDEPDIDCELLRMVDIGTPHIAGYSFDGKMEGLMMIYRAACEYFGLEVKKRAEDFLPEPQVKQIIIDAAGGEEQEILHQTVQQVYAINRDDFNTREILMAHEKSRGRFFDDLRKNYPIRREFQNTTVALAAEDTLLRPTGYAGQAESTEEKLKNKLRGIGFQVKSEK